MGVQAHRGNVPRTAPRSRTCSPGSPSFATKNSGGLAPAVVRRLAGRQRDACGGDRQRRAGLLLSALLPLVHETLTGALTIAIAVWCLTLLIVSKLDPLSLVVGAALARLLQAL